jgi:hypothetical protein
VLTVEGVHAGLGATGRLLVKGQDFNCNASICYGIGAANHALFQQLQQTLNQYARMGLTAFRSPLVVDGFIGSATTAAARAAATAALLPDPGSTKEAIAANAQILLYGLQNFLGSVGAPPSPIVTSQPTPASVPVSTAASQGASITQPTAQPLPQQAAAAGQIPSRTASTAPMAPTTAPPTTTAPSASIAPTPAKVPLWVWIAGGAVGVVVIGGIGYALLNKPKADVPY